MPETLDKQPFYKQISLAPDDTRRLANLCGRFSEHLHQIEQHLDIRIRQRGNSFTLAGDERVVGVASQVLAHLYGETGNNRELTPAMVYLHLLQLTQEDDLKEDPQGSPPASDAQPSNGGDTAAALGAAGGQSLEEDTAPLPGGKLPPPSPRRPSTHPPHSGQAPLPSGQALPPSGQAPPPSGTAPPPTREQAEPLLHTGRCTIRPITTGQRALVQAMRQHEINFAIGPAGTGKTYLAVASALAALERDEIQRLVLVRPAVEAGEKLGFLPGDPSRKVDPYLRPLYDALHEMHGASRVHQLLERNVIEIAPLAFMRGRSLNHCYIILDEAQNTTEKQMKMFLTRIGFGSRATITGDITQMDLPPGQGSGLIHAARVLHRVKGIHFSYLRDRDIVRHPLVQRIVAAYGAHKESQNAPQQKPTEEGLKK